MVIRYLRGPRPPGRTKRCSRCGTVFGTHYAWRTHDRHECNDAITAEMALRMMNRVRALEASLLLGGGNILGLKGAPYDFGAFGELEKPQPESLPFRQLVYQTSPSQASYGTQFGGIPFYGSELTLAQLAAAQRELGPRLPLLKARAMPAGVVPEGEVWLIGSKGDIAKIMNIGKEPRGDAEKQAADGGEADAGADPAQPD